MVRVVDGEATERVPVQSGRRDLAGQTRQGNVHARLMLRSPWERIRGDPSASG